VGLLAACGSPEDPSDEVGLDPLRIQRVPRVTAPAPRSVREFGASGDGVTDDTDAMQAAADWLCAHPSATLVYPPGTYLVDRVVGWSDVVGGLRSHSVAYVGCHHVKISGYGARIEVKGDFVKSPNGEVEGFGVRAAFADRFAVTPFLFEDAHHFVLEGFEIDGNVTETTVSDPGVLLIEGPEHGVSTGNCHDYRLVDLNVHHMNADGILIGTGTIDENVEIRGAILANNARNGLSIIQARDVWVVDSVLRDSGVVGSAPDSYPAHSPARGAAMEADCTPEHATWGEERSRCPGFAIAGNILFEGVTVTGNLGGGISAPYGDRTGNVTIRRSFIANPPGEGGAAVTLGIAGGVLEDSTVYGELGTIEPCFAAAPAEAYRSPTLTSGLALLAATTGLVGPRIARQTEAIASTTIQRNRIFGKRSLLTCPGGIHALTITDNEMIGQQGADVAEDLEYALYGFLAIYDLAKYLIPSVETPHTLFAGNHVFIPASAPRTASGEVFLFGVETSRGNHFTTDSTDVDDPFRVVYDHVGTIEQDQVPNDATIIPVHGPAREGDPEDYPSNAPFTQGGVYSSSSS
jgi:hypothetical protein